MIPKIIKYHNDIIDRNTTFLKIIQRLYIKNIISIPNEIENYILKIKGPL